MFRKTGPQLNKSATKRCTAVFLKFAIHQKNRTVQNVTPVTTIALCAMCAVTGEKSSATGEVRQQGVNLKKKKKKESNSCPRADANRRNSGVRTDIGQSPQVRGGTRAAAVPKAFGGLKRMQTCEGCKLMQSHVTNGPRQRQERTLAPGPISMSSSPWRHQYCSTP